MSARATAVARASWSSCPPWGDTTPQTMPWRANDHVMGSTLSGLGGWSCGSTDVGPRRTGALRLGAVRSPWTGGSAGTESSSSTTTAVRRKRRAISRKCSAKPLLGIGLFVLVRDRCDQESRPMARSARFKDQVIANLAQCCPRDVQPHAATFRLPRETRYRKCRRDPVCGSRDPSPRRGTFSPTRQARFVVRGAHSGRKANRSHCPRD